LRAVWLDGSLSGVRMDLASLSPQESSSGRIRLSRGSEPASEASARLLSTQRPTVRSARPIAEPTAAPQSRPTRRWLVVALVGSALAVGLGAGTMLRGERVPSAAAATSAAASASSIGAASPVPPLAQAEPSSVAPVSSQTSAAPPASAKGVSQPRLVTSPARSGPAGRPRRGKSYDFGF